MPRSLTRRDRGWDHGLDDTQLTAAAHGDGPLVILAGAGTGKTRTLTARVASLVDRGVPPERILLLTFTRRAADDMVARAAAMCTRPDAGRRLQGGTFHAVAHDLVARNTEALGLPLAVSVLDRSDSTDVMDFLRHDHELDGTDVRYPKASTLVDIYSRSVSTGRPARELIATDFGWVEPHLDQVMAHSARLRHAEARAWPDRLRRPLAGLAQPAGRPVPRPGDRRPLGSRAGGRVPGCQPDPGRHRARAPADRHRADRRR